uniref:EAL domain-containing protein n=1 Tax=Ascaris lumbricoides TaxID=6252 RepID=A0A0M3I460_ASCLU
MRIKACELELAYVMQLSAVFYRFKLCELMTLELPIVECLF